MMSVNDVCECVCVCVCVEQPTCMDAMGKRLR